MNFYIQVLTHTQTAKAAELILASKELFAGDCECRVKIASGGVVRTRRHESLTVAVAEISKSRFNELEISCILGKSNSSRILGNPISIVGVFYPSPSSELWFNSNKWPVGGERGMRNRRMNAKAKELSLINFQVQSKPSIFEMAVEIHSKKSRAKLLDECAEWIYKDFPTSLGEISPFGCVDVGNTDFCVEFETNVLMTEDIRIMAKLLPSGYPLLGVKFEALHPIMFGSNSFCRGLSVALGPSARLVNCEATSEFGVLQCAVGETTPELRSKLSNWLFPMTPTGAIGPA